MTDLYILAVLMEQKAQDGPTRTACIILHYAGQQADIGYINRKGKGKMTAKELKDKVDFYVSHGHEDDVVLVTLANRSIGGRASTAVQNIVTGFD